DRIKARQAAFTVIAAQVSRIKSNLDGEYDKQQVVDAAAVIQALAHTNVGSWFPAGTQTGAGLHDTQVRSEWIDAANANKTAGAAASGREEADRRAIVAALGDRDAVQDQVAAMRSTCKGCHDSLRADSLPPSIPSPAAGSL